MYSIQTSVFSIARLLYSTGRRLRPGDKFLLLPCENNTYRVSKTKASQFDPSLLSGDVRVVVVTNPPERGSFSGDAKHRVPELVWSNPEKHLRNWENEGILLSEIIAYRKGDACYNPSFVGRR